MPTGSVASPAGVVFHRSVGLCPGACGLARIPLALADIAHPPRPALAVPTDGRSGLVQATPAPSGGSRAEDQSSLPWSWRVQECDGEQDHSPHPALGVTYVL